MSDSAISSLGDRPAVWPTASLSGNCAKILSSAISRSLIDFIVGVPDSILSETLRALGERFTIHYMPREDVAIAAAVGAELNGCHPLVFMKNAGLGNALDALISLAICYGIPLVVVVGWSGSNSDNLPHHVVWGDRTLAVVGALGLEHQVLELVPGITGEAIGVFLDAAFENGELRFILVGPE